MSDYSDEDFEMSGSGTVGTFDRKQVAGLGAGRGAKVATGGAKNVSPFQAKKGKADDFKLDDDDDDGGYGGGGVGPTSEDYEDDDFDDEEEEEFKKTAVEFAKKLTALRESAKFEMAEGGEDPT